MTTTGRLPPNATDASRARYRLAVELAQQCPPELGTEILLSGSTVYGLADEYSDLEMGFLVDRLPPPPERAQWLRASRTDWLKNLGATEIAIAEYLTADDTIWAKCLFKNTWIECGWQDVPTREQQLTAILSGDVTDHYLLTRATVTEGALPLRTSGRLAEWWRRLAHYPEVLQAKLIAQVGAEWGDRHAVNGPSHWGVRQDHGLMFAGTLVADVHRLLRLLFAINRKWETYWKWLRHDTEGFSRKPLRFVERIESLFAAGRPVERRLECNRLILDTLLLVREPYDGSLAIATVRESLRTHSVLG